MEISRGLHIFVYHLEILKPALIKICKEYLAFDDRLLLLIGIPFLSFLMPFLLQYEGKVSIEEDYWTCHVPNSIMYVTTFWLFYRWLLIFLRRRYPSFKDTFRRNVIQYTIILVTVPIIKAVLSTMLNYLLVHWLGMAAYQVPFTIANTMTIYFPSILILVIYEAVFFFEQYKEVSIQREKLEKVHVETQLVHLRNQINPHFLFNSLSVLNNLIASDPDSAMAYLDKLSRFYRQTVAVEGEKLTPISSEIERAKLYGDLLQERFRDALTLLFEEVDSTIAKIPVLSLQLLIENAIKHNIVSREQPLEIHIRLTSDGKYIVVCNDLQPKLTVVNSTGIGLDNIRKRIAFFTNQELIVKQSDRQFCVQLPLIF